MKKLLAFIVFIAFAFGVYYFKDLNEEDPTTYHYRENFETLDQSLWYVGEWKTHVAAYEKAKINNGKLKLEIDEIDLGPYLLSKPILLEEGDILTVTRKVKLLPTDEPFTAGFALFESNDFGVIPSVLNENNNGLGNALVLVEYVKNYDLESKRPGNNVIRVLPRTWMIESNFALVECDFDKWFEETIIYDTVEGTITYQKGNEKSILVSEPLVKNGVRLYMHGYGFDIGHAIEIDWIEISVE